MRTFARPMNTETRRLLAVAVPWILLALGVFLFPKTAHSVRFQDSEYFRASGSYIVPMDDPDAREVALPRKP